MRSKRTAILHQSHVSQPQPMNSRKTYIHIPVLKNLIWHVFLFCPFFLTKSLDRRNADLHFSPFALKYKGYIIIFDGTLFVRRNFIVLRIFFVEFSAFFLCDNSNFRTLVFSSGFFMSCEKSISLLKYALRVFYLRQYFRIQNT